MHIYTWTTVSLENPDYYSCHNKILQTRWPKQQKFILLQFQRLEVQVQSIRRMGFSQGSPLRLAGIHLPVVPSYDIFSVCVHTDVLLKA